MSPRKLTNDTKQEILKLYRETLETTSTLAERYGVSSSTISRFLKSSLSELEYEDLIQQKRLARTTKGETDDETLVVDHEPIPEPGITPKEETTSEPAIASISKSRPKLKDKSKSSVAEVSQPTDEKQLDLFEAESQEEEEEAVDVISLGEILGEDLSDLDEDEDDLDEEDDEDWDDDLEDSYSAAIPANSRVQVLPFSAVTLPKTCYLVIDRTAELIVRPLKEFGDLGAIPPEEVQEKTLPIFDNHRVARRFSNRSQRVIKVPDSKIISKTRSYLTAKGITRLLMNGTIYSL